jgi:hypothetical protein
MEVYVPSSAVIFGRTDDPNTAGYEPQETPGTVRFDPGVSYELMIRPDGTDDDLAQAVEALRAVPAVDRVVLSSSAMTQRGFRHLLRMPWLREFASSYVADAGLDTVRQLPALRLLRLSTADVTDRGLAQLTDMPELRELWLDHTQIGDAGLHNLRGLRALETLNLDECTNVTDRGVAALAELPNLKHLGLQYCWRITARGLDALRAMPGLQSVGVCRPASFKVRLLRKFGIVGKIIYGTFTDAALDRLIEARPDCEVNLAVNHEIIQEMIDDLEAAEARERRRGG